MSKLLKALLLVLCAVALVGGSVAGTLAFLSMKTAPVTNTFTSGNIDISLKQATFTTADQSMTMLPGKVYTANPVVTVYAGSESCWLFIKIEETIADTVNAATEGDGGNTAFTEPTFRDYLDYTVNTGENGWTAVGSSAPGVYYRQVTLNSSADQSFEIITGNKITAKTTCTKAQYDRLGGKNLNMSITAYAVQLYGFTDVATAWTEAQKAQHYPDKY